jgi:hypothetical protein
VALSVTQPASPVLNTILSTSGIMASSALHETLPGLEWLKEIPISSSSSRLSISEGREKLRYEQVLPLQALIAYRQQAVTETLLQAYERYLERGLKPANDRLLSTGAPRDGYSAVSPPLESTMNSDGASHESKGEEKSEKKNEVEKEAEVDAEVEVEAEADSELQTEKGARKGKRTFNKLIKSIFKSKDKDKELSEKKDPRSIIPTVASGRGDSSPHSDAMTGDISISKSNKAALKMISNLFVRRTYAGTERRADYLPSPPPPTTSDDVSLEDFSEALLGGIKDRTEGGMLLHLVIKASVSVRLSDTAPLIDAHVSFGGDLSAKSVADLRVSCYLSDLRIEDLVTPTPVYRTLLSFGASAGGSSEESYQEQISLLYVTSSVGSSSLQAYSQPLEIAINVLCLERLSELVAARVAGLLKVIAAFNENDYLRKSAEWGAEGVITATTGADMASKVAAAIAGDSMDITVEVSCNKVILPMNTGKDEGSFILNLGRAGLTGAYSPTSGLSLALSVSDLSAGMTPTGGLHDTDRDVGYLLQPVDAHLTFFVPGSDRDKDRDKHRDIVVAAAPPSTSTSNPTAPSTTASTSSSKVFKSGQTDINPDATPAGTDPDLLIDLHVKSELQIVLTPPNLVEIVKYARIFISYVWNVYNIFSSHLGDPAKYITDEKLAQGLHFLNKVLNPTTREKGEHHGPLRRSTPISRSKKQITKGVSKIFSRMTHSIAGPAVGSSIGPGGTLLSGEDDLVCVWSSGMTCLESN